MSNLSDILIEKIVQNSFDVYNKLPKTGKPIEKEWTVLSSFIEHDKTTNKIEVVSLGTGSKCIGATKMSPTGSILNDSHAEVFARRGFLIYLYENIDKASRSEQSIFNKTEDGHLRLKDSIEFVFYSSQLPCGDASIISGTEENYGDLIEPQSLKREAGNEICDTEIKKQKTGDYIFRTGAKCLPHSEQDLKEQGTIQLKLSQVRIKPGRGDRTLSVSCSDKIAKWIHMGVQGSLLNMLCDPIYIKHFIFGSGVPYSEESLRRALLNRSDSTIKLDVVPQLYECKLVFSNVSTDGDVKPAPGSIVWIKLSTPILEVAVQGRKLGVTVKKAISPGCSLSISKYNIYKKFLHILNNNEDLRQKICGQENINSIPYNNMKRKSISYVKKWLDVKQNFFKTWTIKPDMWDFCVDVSYCNKTL